MILIITLNPLLEKRLSFKRIISDSVNRNSAQSIKPGGKGINVSRQLKQLGLSSYNLIFSGGNNGKVYRDILRKENFEFSYIQTKSETRFAPVIIEEEENIITSYFSEDPVITERETAEFIKRLDKMIENCEMVVFSGSSPKGAENIIPAGIEIANKYDKVSICDTYGNNLEKCLNLSPTIIHNNYDETKSSLKVLLNDQQEIISYLDYLYNKGIKRSYLTDGSDPFYASNFDYHYKIYPPEVNAIDSTGSGDSFVAGIIYGWHHNLVFENSLKYATALASTNSTSFEVSNVNSEEAKSLSHSVEIESVGKKIKIIDDSPH
ncbi:MAG: PfkB family carbohydrate kinase [Ignavibacteriaceae bacterium]